MKVGRVQWPQIVNVTHKSKKEKNNKEPAHNLEGRRTCCWSSIFRISNEVRWILSSTWKSKECMTEMHTQDRNSGRRKYIVTIIIFRTKELSTHFILYHSHRWRSSVYQTFSWGTAVHQTAIHSLFIHSLQHDRWQSINHNTPTVNHFLSTFCIMDMSDHYLRALLRFKMKFHFKKTKKCRNQIMNFHFMNITKT